jgi:hypothetical protein
MITKLSAGPIVIGLYVWVLTIFFGMILLDILYGRLAPEVSGAFTAVSDALLLVGFAAVLSGIAAIALTWKSKAARNYLIASFLFLLLEFIIPINGCTIHSGD